MQRINTPTAAQNLFGPGKHGFTDGDVYAAVPTTRLIAAWFNALQEEVARVIEAAGLVLDPSDHTQLLQAIGLVVQNIVNNTSFNADTLDGLDSSYFAPLNALLAHINDRNNPHDVTLAQLGGAPLDGPNFTGNPRAPTPPANDNDTSLATTAFTQAAILAALQGAGLTGGFSQSFGQNGWCRLPNGLIHQWGRHAGGGGEGIGPSILFPITFPNAALGVSVVDWNLSGINRKAVDCYVQVMGHPTSSSFSTYVQHPGGSSNYWEGFFWQAVGF
ncbi:hypothetical protein [Pseudoxanthomonas sp. UTMC 1351]|uniref:gp53-like domain-containing protein n=1 Tax=Pseudoxanthomonas sp. UTMC 1351 TaxID=2695853 RepID=UPI0034CDC29D